MKQAHVPGQVSHMREGPQGAAGPDPTAEQQLVEALRQVLGSADELAHVAVFDWYRGNGLTQKLIEVRRRCVSVCS